MAPVCCGQKGDSRIKQMQSQGTRDGRRGEGNMTATNEKWRENKGTASAVLGRRWVLPLGIALLGLALNTIVAIKMAMTSDEPSHVGYGVAVLKGSPERSLTYFRFNSQMPVSALNALPHAVGKLLRTSGLAERLGERLSGFRAARFPTVLAAFGLCLLIYVYGKSLYGRTAALFAEGLCVLSPNIMAHSTLGTVCMVLSRSFCFCSLSAYSFCTRI